MAHLPISIPGFRNLLDVYERPHRRVFWGFLIVVMLALTIFQVQERFHLYYNQSLELDYKFVHSEELEFPSVTICPFLGFDHLLMEANMVNEIVASHKNDLEEIWSLMKINFVSHLSTCKFGNSTNQTCLLAEHWKSRSTLLGICHTLDFPNGVNYIGISTALRINMNKIFVNVSDAPITVLLHPIDEDITYSILTNGLRLFPQMASIITFTHRLNIYENITERPCRAVHSVQRCKIQCLDKIILKNSTCRLPFTRTSKKPLCTKLEEFMRIYPIPLDKSEDFDDFHKCDIDCGMPCQKNSFDLFMDVRGQRSDSSNTLGFTIWPFRNGKAIWAEKFTYGLVALVCDIGNLVGLFLGVSVFTIIEIIEAVIDNMQRKLSAKKRQQ